MRPGNAIILRGLLLHFHPIIHQNHVGLHTHFGACLRTSIRITCLKNLTGIRKFRSKRYSATIKTLITDERFLVHNKFITCIH